MKLYNTLTRKVEDFEPQDAENVKVYTCGPTVYSFAHIGNYTSYIYWDLLVRTLNAKNWKVNRVMNITDVGHLTSDADDGDDKMEKGAKREGKTVWEIAEKYMGNFLEGFRALNLCEPAAICRATDFVKEDIALVEELDKKGFLYDTEDGLYFDTAKFPAYAEFARLDLDHLRAGARVEFSEEKRNVSDFAVWKWIREGEDHAMQWEYRGRMGYPGWHIECATIARERFGGTLDIHCGGIDHIPIHHTNEIAQYEAAFDEKMSRFWLHNNFITIEGQKASKSLGNAYTFSDLADRGFSALDYKMWVLQGHYQSERNFSFEDLKAAKKRLLNYRNYAALRWQEKPQGDLDEVKSKIIEQLDNNLNSAGALAVLDGVLDSTVPSKDFIEWLDERFGLGLIGLSENISESTKALIEKRSEAKAIKDYAESDRLRDEILSLGIVVRDTANGPIWAYAE